MSNTGSKRKRRRVWNRDKGKCFYCGKDVQFGSPDFTLDHVVPRSKGGPGTVWNLATCCLECNYTKDDSDPDEERLNIVNRRRVLADTSIMLGRAFGHVKAAGDLEAAEYLLALQRITLNVLYGTPVFDSVGRYDSESPTFVETLAKAWNVFTHTVQGLENLNRVQVHDKKLEAVERLLGGVEVHNHG